MRSLVALLVALLASTSADAQLMPAIQVVTWSNYKCEATWQNGIQNCAFDKVFNVDEVQAIAGRYEYCSHEVSRHNVDGEIRSAYIEDPEPTGLRLAMRVERGPWIDQTRGSFDLTIKVRAIGKGTSQSVRVLNGCTPAVPAAGLASQFFCGCVTGSSSQAAQARSCAAGSGRCDRMSGLTFSRCVPNQGACVEAMRGGTCPFDLDRNRYHFIGVPNSPQCP